MKLTNSESLSLSHPVALPLVIYDNDKFIIPKEARTLLSNEAFSNIGVISLVGKYRTGKSFLLNRVLLNRKREKGFGVGPTFKPCTKGIWIWSEPMHISNKYSTETFPCFLIDTEGLCAYDEEINHDSKIFLIAILISSLFIYNSFGAIDETTITSLSFVLNLSKSIKIHNNSADDSSDDLGEYFPTLLWLLRDFHLKLEDTKGNAITEREYLENALRNVKGSTEAIEEKNQVRSLIRSFFPERDCFTMVRPVEKESDLQNLQHLNDDQLRTEFIDQAESFREMIFDKVKPKIFMKKPLTGEMLVDFIQSILNAINEGNIPVIENSWKYVVQSECIKKSSMTLDKFKSELQEFRNKNESSLNYFNEISQYTKALLAKYIIDFEANTPVLNDDENKAEYINKLKQKLNMEIELFNKENELLCEKRFTSELEKVSKTFIDSLTTNSDKYAKNYYAFFNDLETFKTQCESTTPDFPNKRDLLTDSIMIIIKKFIEVNFIKSKAQSEKEISAYKSAIDKLQLKLKSTTDELIKLKQEHSSYLERINNSIVDEKVKHKTYEDKLQVLLNEKKIEKERYERNLHQIKADHEKKYESTINANNKYQNELKIKEEQLQMFKGNNQKINAINDQKILFLDKELIALKEKYNALATEAKLKENNLVNENSLLKAQIESLKTESKQYNKKSTEAMNSNFNNLEQLLNDQFQNQRIENKSLIQNMMTQQKDNMATKSIMSEYKDLNDQKQKMAQTLAGIENRNKQLEDQMNKLLLYKEIVGQTIGFKCRSCLRLLSFDQFKGHYKQCQNELRTSRERTKKMSMMSHRLEISQLIKLKIIKGRVMQDEIGKPFLEYLIDVEYNGQNWRVNKRFNQFANLYKAIKTLFQGVITLPSSVSIFVNINEMNSSSTFHENKITQLDLFIKDLAQIDAVNRSKVFRRFFEFEKYIDEEIVNDIGLEAKNDEEEFKDIGIDNDNDNDKNDYNNIENYDSNKPNNTENSNEDRENNDYDYDY